MLILIVSISFHVPKLLEDNLSYFAKNSEFIANSLMLKKRRNANGLKFIFVS